MREKSFIDLYALMRLRQATETHIHPFILLISLGAEKRGISEGKRQKMKLAFQLQFVLGQRRQEEAAKTARKSK